MRAIVVGAGWAGIAAAYELNKKQVDVTLIEKSEHILGTGLVGGIMRNNGRDTVLKELKAMGIGELIQFIEEHYVIRNIDIPGNNHTYLYNVNTIEATILALLKFKGVNVVLRERVISANKNGNRIVNVETDKKNYEADVFVDATGTCGPINNCCDYGAGCVGCLMNCGKYGDRVSLTSLAGAEEFPITYGKQTIGVFSGSMEININSLADETRNELISKGMIKVPLPKEMIKNDITSKACKQYSDEEYINNLIVLYNGQAKIMKAHFPIYDLRTLPGFESVEIIDPKSNRGNSVRFCNVSPHFKDLLVDGVDNLFCAGEKSGLIGHTEALATGILAGYNASRLLESKNTIVLPNSIATGYAINYVSDALRTKDGRNRQYTVAGSHLFAEIVDKGLYETDDEKIARLVLNNGLANLF